VENLNMDDKGEMEHLAINVFRTGKNVHQSLLQLIIEFKFEINYNNMVKTLFFWFALFE